MIAASMEGHLEVVKVLLRYGADSEVKDKEGWKAVDHAAMAGHNEYVAIVVYSFNQNRLFLGQQQYNKDP